MSRRSDRIFGILPEDMGKNLRELWEEFERNDTSEANFAHAMDNLQPMMLNDHTDGKAWREHSVVLSKILERNKTTKQGSEILWEYAFENILKPNVEKGNIIDDVSK